MAGGGSGGAQMAAGSASAGANKMAAPLPSAFVRRSICWHRILVIFAAPLNNSVCVLQNLSQVAGRHAHNAQWQPTHNPPPPGGNPNFVLGWRRLGHRRLVYGT